VASRPRAAAPFPRAATLPLARGVAPLVYANVGRFFKTGASAAVLVRDVDVYAETEAAHVCPTARRQGCRRRFGGRVTGCLETHGYLALRPRSRLSSRWGLADLIGIRDGHTIFVLAGATPGRLSRRTQHFVENIRRSGSEFVVVRDLGDVEALSHTRLAADGAFSNAPAEDTRTHLRAAPSAKTVTARRESSHGPRVGPRERAAEPYAGAAAR
jgi:hypothetical protein